MSARAFNTSTSSTPAPATICIGATKVDIDAAWGFTLQAGVDVSLGNGWSLNADVKKTWLDTTVTWHNAAVAGGVNVVGDADVDPWIFSAGLGYRFNLGSIFGHGAEAAPIKKRQSGAVRKGPAAAGPFVAFGVRGGPNNALPSAGLRG